MREDYILHTVQDEIVDDDCCDSTVLCDVDFNKLLKNGFFRSKNIRDTIVDCNDTICTLHFTMDAVDTNPDEIKEFIDEWVELNYVCTKACDEYVKVYEDEKTNSYLVIVECKPYEILNELNDLDEVYAPINRVNKSTGQRQIVKRVKAQVSTANYRKMFIISKEKNLNYNLIKKRIDECFEYSKDEHGEYVFDKFKEMFLYYFESLLRDRNNYKFITDDKMAHESIIKGSKVYVTYEDIQYEFDKNGGQCNLLQSGGYSIIYYIHK